MPKGTVVTYASRLGKPLRAHQRIMLVADAKAIAGLTQYEFGGDYGAAANNKRSGHIYFVPDDTLLLDEAESLGIRAATDLYGGVVPHPFVKTKAITHPLVDKDAHRPDGWLFRFGERIRNAVLPGYTVFCRRDARIAAGRMLLRGPIRLKDPREAGGRGQTVITAPNELDELLDRFSMDNLAYSGLVLEENLHQVATLSVGHIAVSNLSFTYCGRQRVTTNNENRPAYGGSDLICVRGGWDALYQLPMGHAVRVGVEKARVYDEATNAYAGFMASRRNYDVGLGLDVNGNYGSGVFESSWRAGGATGAEVAALAEFMRDSSVEIVEASHVEEFGRDLEPPPEALTSIRLDDPQDGPMIRYTVVRRIERAKRRA
ncbi:DUF3182 family protein [Bradyrhizobium sp. Leo121]|uniref:DUF3182 family protein n=1 Tax=Bradyrhizobium sp. Leo121 TaxID=1571195 RepID=UPI00102972E5|nr:DUF3182 family protein [Bradyrhizobium sp. Leo121]RZN33897.1 DUF3182 domain-containing protein [Bradyrhizobium sp. Leo121]